MNLHCIEAFYWAATLKGVGRAAEKLFIEQPAVSARIKVLEDELGTKLLDRRADKRFRLTPAGARFLVEAERLLEHWREIKTGPGSDKQRAVSLRVGAVASVLHSWLIPWLEQLRREHPGVQLELTVETTPMLLELMRLGALDLVLAALPVPGETHMEPGALMGRAILERCTALVPELAEARVLTQLVGLRPVRHGGARVEADALGLPGGGTLIHDYGHGGAGVTLCWGCADEVASLVRAS